MVKFEKTSLLIKHFPNELSKEERKHFLKFFGATDVKFLTSTHKKGSFAFAKFPDERSAEYALTKLHQVQVFDQLLSVEYVRGSDNDRYFSSEEYRKDEIKENQTTERRYLDNFIQRLNSWTNHLDFQQPPPVHLKYQYPPPNLQVLTNITKILASVPKFYTQVLHLMNKMNLPCPFSEKFSIDVDILQENFPNNILKNEKRTKLSEEESELESGDEKERETNVIPVKRKVVEKKRNIKRPKLIPNVELKGDKSKPMMKPNEIFETELKDLSKKIEVKVNTDLKALEETREEIAGENFEKIKMLECISSEEILLKESQRVPEQKGVISSEELALNRISSKDQHVLPVFKNYQAGTPSCRLYIKNLAKTVTVADLKYIYARYVTDVEEAQGVMFDVQLLQEGRMKGQAFISLQSVDEAKLALSETNGYILKGKPMVVQFARSSKPKT